MIPTDLSDEQRRALYGPRADDAVRLQEALLQLDRADNELLGAELAIDQIEETDEDGDLIACERADISHEISVARRSLRNLARILRCHDEDLRELASEEEPDGDR